MMRYILILVCLLLIFVTSCYRDLGNYDYTLIDSVRIENVLEKYPDMIIFEDTLKIFPKVTHPEGKYSYKWYRMKSEKEFELISEELNLVYPLVHAGTNSIYFFVKDEKYGLEKWISTSCVAMSKTSEGLFVLKETDEGYTDVDLFLSVSEPYPNMLKNKFGEALPGLPKALDYWGYQWEDYENDTIVRIPTLRVGSEKDLWVLNTRNFDRVMRLDSMFLDEKPESIKIAEFQSTKELSVLTYNDGKCCVFNNATGSRLLPELLGKYSLGVGLCSRYGGDSFYCFDQQAGTFHYLAAVATTLLNMQKAEVNGIPLRNTGKELVFMGSGKMNYGLILMKNKEGVRDSLFLYSLLFTRVQPSVVELVTVDTIKENSKLHQANLYSFHKDLNFLYFSCDEGDYSVVYCYDMKKKEEKEVWRSTKGKITHIQYVNEYYAKGLGAPTTPAEMKVVISTYQNGTYEIRYFQAVNNTLEELVDEIYEGTGGKVRKIIKVKDNTDPYWMYYVNN